MPLVEPRLFDRLLKIRREIHEQPELSWQEYQTANRVATFLEELGIAHRRVAGTGIIAVGFAIDPLVKTAKIFELVSQDATPIRFLLNELVSRCQREDEVQYLEADVSAFSPRMQRTFSVEFIIVTPIV